MNTPRTAQSNDELAELDRDNIGIGFYWMVVDEEIMTLARQISGQDAEVVLTMPRPIFNQFVDWYNTGVEPEGMSDD